MRSTPNLTVAITTGDKIGIAVALKSFKTEMGTPNFPALLSIPTDNRLTKFAEKDLAGTIGIISAALTMAFEGMNLKRPMNPSQILDLAEVVVDTAGEDSLAMEDFMLFLQKLVRGEYGVLYESMDIPKFMEKFEMYREERWQELNRIRLDRHAQLTGMGDATKTTQRNELDEHFMNLAGHLGEMKDKLKETRAENKKLRDIDKF